MTSHEDNIQNTSQSSGSGTTGPGSFIVTEEFQDHEMDSLRDETKADDCVDQGTSLFEAPRALYTSGEESPQTGYEPKPSSIKEEMVDGRRFISSKMEPVQEFEHRLEGENNPSDFGQFVASTVKVQCAGWEHEKDQEEDDYDPAEMDQTDFVLRPVGIYTDMDGGSYHSDLDEGHSPMSTASVQCAGEESGYGQQAKAEDNYHPEMFNLQHGLNSSQSDHRDFGSEMAFLEEKIQEVHQALCKEMVNYGTKEELAKKIKEILTMR